MSAAEDAALSLLSALGRHFDIEGLSPGAQGVVALLIDERLTVHVLLKSDEQEFVLFAVVASLPPDPPAGSLITLLQANRFWHQTGGATLSLDDEQPPRVILAGRVPWAGLTVAKFIDEFDNFTNWLDQWKRDLASVAATPADADRPRGVSLFA